MIIKEEIVMFKFLKNLFSPVQIPPQKPEPHPLDGATRAAHAKNPLIDTAPPPAPELFPAPTPAELIPPAPVEKLPVVEIVPELTLQPEEAPVVEKKPRKPRAKKVEPVEDVNWPFPGPGPAAMTASNTEKKPRKPRTKAAN
jgi:hypothetical protein